MLTTFNRRFNSIKYISKDAFIKSNCVFSEATHEEGLELPMGEEGRLRPEAGGEICWPAPGQCKNFPQSFLQVTFLILLPFEKLSLCQRAQVHPGPWEGADPGGAGGSDCRAWPGEQTREQGQWGGGQQARQQSRRQDPGEESSEHCRVSKEYFLHFDEL